VISLKRFAQELFFSGKILTKLRQIKSFEVGLFLSVFVVSLFLNFATQKYSVPNTDSNQTDLFSDLLTKNQTLRYHNPINSRYGIPIFGIRGLLNFGNDYFVSSASPGAIVIQALFKFANLSAFFINPIFVVIGLYFFNKIVNIFIFNNRFWSLVTTAIYFFSGAFIFVSSLPFKDLVATATFFAGLYYILNGAYDKKAINFALFGVLASVTMCMSYPNVMFYLPAVAFYLFTIRNEILERQNLRNLTITFIFFFPLFISLYLYQVWSFDGFLNFNSPVFRLNHYEEFAVQSNISSFLLNVNIIKLLTNFWNQFFLVNVILISFSVSGFLYVIFDCIKRKKANKVLLVLLALVAMQFLFYLGKDWSGVTFKGSAGTSYSRYLLISWGVLIILSVGAVKRMVNALNIGYASKRTVLTLIFICLVFSGLISGLYSSMAVISFIETSEWANELRNDIIENTPKNSIIFTSFYDKYIYPVRQTAIYVAIPEEERLNKTMYLMKELLEDGYSVYIVDERDGYAISPVLNKDAFEENQLETEMAFRAAHTMDFYRITPSEN